MQRYWGLWNKQLQGWMIDENSNPIYYPLESIAIARLEHLAEYAEGVIVREFEQDA